MLTNGYYMIFINNKRIMNLYKSISPKPLFYLQQCIRNHIAMIADAKYSEVNIIGTNIFKGGDIQNVVGNNFSG